MQDTDGCSHPRSFPMQIPSHMAVESTKTFQHSAGFSVAFRQWRADSHCRHLHGYALKIRLTFGCHHLDYRNWCVDFGGLKVVKEWLEDQYDHRTIIAYDDPHLSQFQGLDKLGVISLRTVPHVGCEAFAMFIFQFLEQTVFKISGDKTPNGLFGQQDRIWIESVEVSEHESNSAIVRRRPT